MTSHAVFTAVVGRQPSETVISAKTDIVLIAPHCDDVAFSLSGALLTGKLAPERCELCTVFTRSSYCVSETMMRTSVAEISAHRVGEDVEFARRLGVEYSHFSLDDAILREGFENIKNVLTTREKALTEPILQSVISVLVETKERVSPTMVVVPLAMGGHVDHWLVRIAAEAVFGDDGILAYYEDLPYAGYVDIPTLDAELAAICDGLKAEIVPEDGWLERKLALLEIYTSQMTERDLTAVRRHTERMGGERLFRSG